MRRFSPAQLAAQERFRRMVKSGAWPRRGRKRKRGNPWYHHADIPGVQTEHESFTTVSGRNLAAVYRPFPGVHEVYAGRPSPKGRAFVGRYPTARAGKKAAMRYLRAGGRGNPTLMVMNPGRKREPWPWEGMSESERYIAFVYGSAQKEYAKRYLTWLRRGGEVPERTIPYKTALLIESDLRRMWRNEPDDLSGTPKQNPKLIASAIRRPNHLHIDARGAQGLTVRQIDKERRGNPSKFSSALGAYVYLRDHHRGQGSPEYAALSRLLRNYKPSLSEESYTYEDLLESDPEAANVYERYQRKYGRGNPRKWIASAIRRPGAFSAKARRAGMSTAAYTREVLRPGSRATTRTKRQAALARTLGRLRPNPWKDFPDGSSLLVRPRGKPGASIRPPSYDRRYDPRGTSYWTWRTQTGARGGASSASEAKRMAMMALRRLRANPGGSSKMGYAPPPQALRMYRRFHGSDPMNVRAIHAPPGTPKHLVMLGKLTELGYRVPGHSGKAGRKNVPYLHKSGRGNILATDSTGRNLYILKDRGSRMRVRSSGIND